jgi:hypothetical protein
MDFIDLKNKTWLLIFIGVMFLALLQGCVTPTNLTNTSSKSNTIANIGLIGEVIGCVFAPQDPSCQKEHYNHPAPTKSP